MKLAHTYRAATAFFLICSGIFNFASASEATIPHTFSAGTPARAAEVNDNFNELKSAVDDNHTRISENATSISDNTTAISDNTTAISDNAAEISLNSSAISKLQEQQSHVYIVNPASVNGAGDIDVEVTLYGVYSSSRLSTRVFAPVSLPQGAVVTDMDCLVVDQDRDEDFILDTGLGYIRLVRKLVNEGASITSPREALVDIPLLTSGFSNEFLRLVDEDGVVEFAEIDNLLYDYGVEYAIRRSGASVLLQVSRCRITYQH